MSKEKKIEKNSSIQNFFKVTLDIGGIIYTETGNTILEAITKMHPQVSKQYGSISIEHDGKLSKLPIKMNPTRLQRIFSKQNELSMFAKRLSTLF